MQQPNGPIHLMIDFETPSSETTTAPLTIGAVQFATTNPNRPVFYDRASLASIERRGFHISTETMKWWDKQDPVMRNEAFGGTKDIEALIDNFIQWCQDSFGVENLQNIELWSRGADFDCKILQHVCMQIWGTYPFNFRNHNCQRTLAKGLPKEFIEAHVGVQRSKHHALEDAIYQARVVEFVMKQTRTWANCDVLTIIA